MIKVNITPRYTPPNAETVQKKRKSVFANVIIAIVIAVGLAVTAAVVHSYYIAEQPIPGDVITALFVFWGGELLIIALRQIFGSDITKKNRTEDFDI